MARARTIARSCSHPGARNRQREEAQLKGEPSRPYLVYVITSPDGTLYVGCTCVPIRVRWGQHACAAYPVALSALNRAIRTTGWHRFSTEVVFASRDRSFARGFEGALMDHLRSRGFRLYNALQTGKNEFFAELSASIFYAPTGLSEPIAAPAGRYFALSDGAHHGAPA